MKEWFKARNIWGAAILSLSDEEAGRLVKAIWSYTMGGEQIELNGAEKGIFAMIHMTLEQDEEQANALSAIRAEAGAKGGKQRIANQASATTDQASQASACNKNKNTEKEKETEREYMFERFWNVYPRHDSKASAKKAFEKLKPTEELLIRIISAIEKQQRTAQWQENGGQFIPYAATWLNQKRWEDEAKPTPMIRAVNAQQYTQRNYDGAQEEAMKRMLEGFG